MSSLSLPASATASDDFTALLAALRPRLHRYCARMAGSALDGEDIVQDALAKAALHYAGHAARASPGTSRPGAALRRALQRTRLRWPARPAGRGGAPSAGGAPADEGQGGGLELLRHYARIGGWRVEAGTIEGRTGLWVHEVDGAVPAYPIVLAWGDGGCVERIRDFRYARYVLEAVPPRQAAAPCAPPPSHVNA